MTAYLTLPIGLLAPKAPDWWLTGAAASSGRTQEGTSQTTNSSGGPRWMLQLSGVWVRERAQVKAWRALEGLLDNGVTGIIVPFCDARHGPYAHTGGIPHSDGTLFYDDTGYASGAGQATFDQAAILRATTVFLDMNGATLEGGEHFTPAGYAAGGPRMHRIVRVKGVVGTVYQCEIRPPLRHAVADGADADFANPRNLMKLASSDEMRLPLEGNRFGNGSPHFEEAFGITALSDA